MDTIPIPEESQDQLAGRKHLQEMDQYWLPIHLVHTPTYTLLICNQNYSIKFPCRKTLLMQKSIVWASAKMLRRSCKQTFFWRMCNLHSREAFKALARKRCEFDAHLHRVWKSLKKSCFYNVTFFQIEKSVNLGLK